MVAPQSHDKQLATEDLQLPRRRMLAWLSGFGLFASAALAVVSHVLVFDDPTPLRLIEALRPEVLVKGGDYREETIVGAEQVRSWGGRVRIVPTVEGFSTTKLIARAVSEPGEAVPTVTEPQPQ